MLYRFPRRLLAVLCAPALVVLVSCGSPRKETKTEARLKPLNLVVVTLDTLRADRVRCYGYQQVETPTLDRLAREGALFENAVAQTPLTPPSHASIFTGTYPTVHKVRNTGGFVLPPSSRTLAAILQEQGWDTAAFIGASVLKKAFGFNQGFAVYDDKMPKARERDEVGDYPERRAGVVVDRALEWLSTQSGKPFFIWLHLYDPHFPYDPPEPFRTAYRRNPYDGEIAYTDRELDRFIAAVEKKSAPQNTVTVVLADHGESLGEHGEYTHGVFIYDSTLHIPLIVKGPGVPSGVRVKQQVRTIDVLPTILDLLGGKPPAACQGVSAAPAFTGADLRAPVSFAESIYPKMNMGWAELTGARTSRWKYIRAPKPELYDLAQDPHETRNVIGEFRKDADELEAALRRYASTDRPEKVEIHEADETTMRQLRSLGYVSGIAPRTIQLDGRGPDPKDRTGVLKAIEMAEGPGSAKRPLAQRIAALERAVADDPTNPTLYFHLGSEYERAGRHPDALKLYQSALDRGIQNGRLHSRIADLQLRAGNKDAAIVEYERASKFNPLDADAQTNLATAYLEKGRVADAERVFKWILTGEQHAAAYNGLGLIAIQRQDPAAARANFEKAVGLDPDLVEAQLNLGLIYRMTGDVPRAKACFEAFLAKASRRQYAGIIPKVKQELASMR